MYTPASTTDSTAAVFMRGNQNLFMIMSLPVQMLQRSRPVTTKAPTATMLLVAMSVLSKVKLKMAARKNPVLITKQSMKISQAS